MASSNVKLKQPNSCASYKATIAADACWYPRLPTPKVVLEEAITAITIYNNSDHTVYCGGTQQDCDDEADGIVYPIPSKSSFGCDLSLSPRIKIRNPSIGQQGGASGSGDYSADIRIFITFNESPKNPIVTPAE